MRVLIVGNVDWFLVSHRLELIRALRSRGAVVAVAAADTGASKQIRSVDGVSFHAIPMSRAKTGIWEAIQSIRTIRKIISATNPDVILNVSVKPIVFGTLSALTTTQRPRIINAITGFGYVFSDHAPRLLKFGVATTYRLLFKSHRVSVIVQNSGAARWVTDHRMIHQDRLHMVPGVGVDCDRFSPESNASDHMPLRVLLAARLLKDKGLIEFVAAAEKLSQLRNDLHFLIAGGFDLDGNPSAFTKADFHSLLEGSQVEWLGEVSDMPALMRSVDIFVLPSYHEGLPRVLLEAAASGLAVIATDIDGCREVVTDGVNGFLVKPRNFDELATSIDRLASNESLRIQFGLKNRELAKSRFEIQGITDQLLGIVLGISDKSP